MNCFEVWAVNQVISEAILPPVCTDLNARLLFFLSCPLPLLWFQPAPLLGFRYAPLCHSVIGAPPLLHPRPVTAPTSHPTRPCLTSAMPTSGSLDTETKGMTPPSPIPDPASSPSPAPGLHLSQHLPTAPH